MEQTKNEPKNENKAAPGNGKPKKERKPLTEAQRLKRQKMIVLPAMVLVFIGAMWLIFAPLNTNTIAGSTIIFCRFSRCASVSGSRSFFGFPVSGAALFSFVGSFFVCSI